MELTGPDAREWMQRFIDVFNHEREVLAELDRCSGHRHHERQVEQQLQRRGRAVTLAGITADHLP